MTKDIMEETNMIATKRVLFAAALGALASAAQAFPERAVKIVVPYAAGGSTDVLARVLAEAMSKNLKQPVVVENAGGAGGTIGMAKVVRAPKDGYTVLLHNMGIASAPALYKNLGFDVTRDLAPVAPAGDVPMILVRNKDFAPATVKTLIQYMKDHPGKVNFAHAGIGATSNLCAMLFVHTTGVKVTMVPYKGTGPALQDLVAGNVDLICDQPVATGPHIQSGYLKPYAVATDRRLAILPEVPTFKEAGLPDFKLSVWHGLYVPQGTPVPVIQRLNQAAAAAFSDPELSKRLSDMGVVVRAPDAMAPERLQAHTVAEVARWSKIIQEAGVAPQ